MDIEGVVQEGVKWTDLAQGKYKWRTLVNAVSKFQVPQKVGNVLTS